MVVSTDNNAKSAAPISHSNITSVERTERQQQLARVKGFVVEFEAKVLPLKIELARLGMLDEEEAQKESYLELGDKVGKLMAPRAVDTFFNYPEPQDVRSYDEKTDKIVERPLTEKEQENVRINTEMSRDINEHGRLDREFDKASNELVQKVVSLVGSEILRSDPLFLKEVITTIESASQDVYHISMDLIIAVSANAKTIQDAHIVLHLLCSDKPEDLESARAFLL